MEAVIVRLYLDLKNKAWENSGMFYCLAAGNPESVFLWLENKYNSTSVLIRWAYD